MIHRVEDHDTIYPIAFALYDHFNTSEEISKMATLMVDNVLIHNANHYFERAVIASLSYLIDNDFKVALTLDELDDPNLVPAVPQNWRNAVSNVINQYIGTDNRIASFFVRKRTQTFKLNLSSTCVIGLACGSVAVDLVHCGNNRGFPLDLHSSEVDGLAEHDRGRAVAFGSHVLKKLLEIMDEPVKRASKDQAPSTPASPI